MKPERIQIRFDRLDGWVLVKESQAGFVEDKPTAVWTAFELSDHLEACELVAEIGVLADRYCVCPEIDVRRNIVFVTVRSPVTGLTEEDFDFAEAIDVELGSGQKANSLIGR